MTEIGDSAFAGCKSLKEIRFAGTKKQWEAVQKGDGFNEGVPAGTVICADGTAEFTQPQFRITDGKLEKFHGTAASVVIPEGVTEIGEEAFKGCTSLTAVSIPEGVTEIGDEAFQRCDKIRSVSIPGSVTEIGKDAFFGCESLAEVRYGGTKAQWLFQLAGFKKGVPEAAAVHCTDGDAKPLGNDITEIDIPDSVTAIGQHAFDGCKSLTAVVIPEGVTAIGSEAFAKCTSLASVSIPEGVTAIGSEAFAKCTSLASVSIPEGVTKIGYKAFYGCTSLTSVAIPASVTKIGEEAFNGCTALKEIHYAGTKDEWKAVKKGKNWKKDVPAKDVLVRKE